MIIPYSEIDASDSASTTDSLPSLYSDSDSSVTSQELWETIWSELSEFDEVYRIPDLTDFYSYLENPNTLGELPSIFYQDHTEYFHRLEIHPRRRGGKERRQTI